MSIIELHTLLNGLKTEEINSVRFSFCKSFRIEKEEAAAEKLFEYLVENQGAELDDELISKHIYGENKPDTLKKLKSRLFYRILDTFTSDAFLLKEGVFDLVDKQSVRIRKKLLQFRVLYRKKNGTDKSVLFHILSEIIKEAKEYELYDVVAEALSLKKYLNVLRKGGEELKEMNSQIRQYQDAYNAVMRAGDAYFDLVSNQDIIKNYTAEEVDKLVNSYLKELEEDYNINQSITILYYSKQIQLAFLQRTQKHQATIDVCLDMINLLNKHKCIYRTERMAAIYSNISKCLVFTGDFQNAAENAEKARNFYNSRNINYVVTREQEFYAYFYGEKYDTANLIIDELITLPIVNSGEFRQDKFQFFKACIYFQQGQFKDALNICNQWLELSRDKGRWDIGTRYLRIMCLVELQLLDQAYSSVEALRKIMSRNKADLSGRDELIYKSLNEFSRASFGPVCNSKLLRLIEDLSQTDSKSAWSYYSHELVPFHEWLKTKLKISLVEEKREKVRV
ncbi:MAG: hypothetical protein ACJ76F_11605 [Bacteroidia bacterium]